MERFTEVCGDNRFELIKKYKEKLIEATNIETSKNEMNVIDSVLFRCWQMGWLDRLEADVVPKSEYDAVVSAVDNSTKEFLNLHDAYQSQKREFDAELIKAKQEVAREIFEEIESKIHEDDFGDLVTDFMEFQELKKKYIGE